MTDLSDKAATLVVWKSRGGKWSAELWRNYAGAYLVTETKNGRSIGCMTRPRGFFANEAEALIWARREVPLAFDVSMIEAKGGAS